MDWETEGAGREPVLISMLEHYSYCPRQCALIHIDAGFDENIYTLRGTLAHRSVDEAGVETRDGVRIAHAMPLWSERLGLIGKADRVEFREGLPYPVEHKIGKKRPDRHSDLQLCAQALCLEEMLGCRVPEGAVYHVSSRRRREVEFTAELRSRVQIVTEEVRAMLAKPDLPPPPADRRCRHCAQVRSCLPELLAGRGRLAALAASLFQPEKDEE